MAYNMAWFRKQAELKKQQEEEARKKGEALPKSENTILDKALECIPPDENQKIEKSSTSTYFKFHKNKNAKNNPHYFMTEELLTPRASSADTQRLDKFGLFKHY